MVKVEQKAVSSVEKIPEVGKARRWRNHLYVC